MRYCLLLVSFFVVLVLLDAANAQPNGEHIDDQTNVPRLRTKRHFYGGGRYPFYGRGFGGRGGFGYGGRGGFGYGGRGRGFGGGFGRFGRGGFGRYGK